MEAPSCQPVPGGAAAGGAAACATGGAAAAAAAAGGAGILPAVRQDHSHPRRSPAATAAAQQPCSGTAPNTAPVCNPCTLAAAEPAEAAPAAIDRPAGSSDPGCTPMPSRASSNTSGSGTPGQPVPGVPQPSQATLEHSSACHCEAGPAGSCQMGSVACKGRHISTNAPSHVATRAWQHAATGPVAHAPPHQR